MPRFASHALNSLNVKIVYFPSPVRFRNTGTWSGNDVMKRGETTKIKKKILLKQIEIKINSVLVIYFYCFSRRCDDCMTLLRGKKKPQNAWILKNREKYAKPFRTFSVQQPFKVFKSFGIFEFSRSSSAKQIRYI